MLRVPAEGFGALLGEAARRLPRPAVPLFAALPAVSDLLGEVVRWTRRVDLTAARTPEELVDLYLADAWVLGGVDAGAGGIRWADVGAGGGAPGLVLALLRPDLRVTLVEPRARRVAFLRSVLAGLGRSDVEVVRARVEHLGGGFDVAVSRATFPPEQWLSAGRLLAAQVWVLLARGAEPEPGPELQIAYRWPWTGSPRRALRYAARPVEPG